MNFDQALETLDIKEYKSRILKSNSQGELFHTADYISIAEILLKHPPENFVFRDWFVGMVEWAENTWNRPESVFQHVLEQLHNR